MYVCMYVCNAQCDGQTQNVTQIHLLVSRLQSNSGLLQITAGIGSWCQNLSNTFSWCLLSVVTSDSEGGGFQTDAELYILVTLCGKSDAHLISK